MSTPIDAANAATMAELIRRCDALDRAVDDKDWAAARTLFADRVAADFSALSGQPRATVEADAIVAGWRRNLTAAKTSQHARSNHQVTLAADRAEVRSVAYAWNRMDGGEGDPLWEVWGIYDYGFVRRGDAWLIDRFVLTVTHQRGSTWVRDTLPPA